MGRFFCFRCKKVVNGYPNQRDDWLFKCGCHWNDADIKKMVVSIKLSMFLPDGREIIKIKESARYVLKEFGGK